MLHLLLLDQVEGATGQSVGKLRLKVLLWDPAASLTPPTAAESFEEPKATSTDHDQPSTTPERAVPLRSLSGFSDTNEYPVTQIDEPRSPEGPVRRLSGASNNNVASFVDPRDIARKAAEDSAAARDAAKVAAVAASLHPTPEHRDSARRAADAAEEAEKSAAGRSINDSIGISGNNEFRQ